VDQPTKTSNDLLHVPNGPMTRSKKKALNVLVLKVLIKSDLKGPLEYQEDDVDQLTNTNKDPLHVPNGPMTWSNTKAMKETLNILVLKVLTKSDLKGPLEYQKAVLIHLINVQKEPNPTLFGS
jgi:predicted small lipoprotein YifL